MKSALPPTPVSVVFIEAVVSFRGQYWVIVTVMNPATRPLAEVDSGTGLSILCRAKKSSLLLLSEVLEPHHVVHRCDGLRGFTTSGPGFEDGAHGTFNEFLDNVHFIW